MDEQTKLLQAMARLSRNPDFQVFSKGYLEKELEKQIDGCITADKPAQYQGAAQVLRKLIKDVDESREKHEQIFGSVPISGANPY